MNSFIFELIDNLPKVISYFVPGAIFISINYYICSKKKGIFEHFIFKSLIISYIIILLSDKMIQTFKITDLEFFKQIFPISIAIISSYILSAFYMSSKFEKFLDYLKIRKTVHDNFWTDIIDYENGTYLTVYLKEEELVYSGAIIKHEEKEDNNYLLMSNYLVYDYEGNKISDMESDQECIVLNTNDISRYELSYSPSSKKIRKAD